MGIFNERFLMLREFKTTCTIDVRTRNAQSGPLECLAHIFEYHHPDTKVFWFGTAEVPLSPSKYHKLLTSDIPEFFRYHIRLPDGRMGVATFFGSEAHSTFIGADAGDFLRVSFHGASQLGLPAEPTGDQITVTDSPPEPPSRPGFSMN
jgi:hypothetical protein